MSVIIKRCTFDEIEISGLTVEYANEASIAELPPAKMQTDHYKALENAGAIYPIGAYFEDMFIGFVTILNPLIPHYGVRVAATESFFVAKAWRKSGAGLKLLHAAEEYAKETGCYGILVSSPSGGDLSEVLPRVGYRETNRVFFKNV